MPEAVAGTYTQSPAGTAFSTLYARAQNYIQGPQDANVAAIAKEGINEGIYRLNTRKWNWARISADIALVTGTQEYALGATFKAPRACQLLNPAGEVAGLLPWIDPKELDAFFPDRSASGSPEAYTIFNIFDNGKFTLARPPAAGFIASYAKVRLRYWRRTAVLSADADLFSGPSEFEPFLVWTARAVVAAHWNIAKYALASTRAEEFWLMLKRDDVMLETGDW